MKALIDADSILYKVGFAIEEKEDWGDGDITYSTDLDQCYETADKIIENIMFACDSDEALLVFTGKDNFRYDNPLGYKQHRKELRKPTGYKEIKEYIWNNYNCYQPEGIEADDYVVYLKTTQPDEYFLAAIDKDVLYQTPGYHYNYGKDEYVNISPKKAMYFEYYQCLVGDTSDGYKGCPGVGPVKAKAILKECNTEAEVWEAVVKSYESKGLTEEDAVNTMRLCSMHQYNGNQVVLWSTASINRDL